MLVRPRPRLLFVSPRFLFPMNEGGKIRTANILRQLKGGSFEVILAAPSPVDASHFRKDVDSICDRFISWNARTVGRSERLMALASSLPVSVATDRSAAGLAVIERALAEDVPDVVVVDFPHAAVLVPQRIDAASVMFTHNVEAEIYERHAKLAKGALALVWQAQARKMKRFEGEALGRFDSVIAVSARDQAALEARYGLPVVERIDTGVDVDYFQPTARRAGSSTVVFVGVLDSPANIDAVKFLMDKVWPAVGRARPDARAVIVGRNPPAALLAAAVARGLPWEFTGSVADIRPYVSLGDVSVIPIRVGSGTRIKAYEAMAMGRPVVSTTVGVEGLDIEPGEHYLSADEPAAFAEAIVRLLDDSVLSERLVQAARVRMEARFSWASVARQFEAICERAVTERATRLDLRRAAA